MAETCLWCNKNLVKYDDDGNRITRVDAKFDSNACRDKYWAAIRKTRRAYIRAKDAIRVLTEMKLEDSNVAMSATMHLSMLAATLKRVTESD